MTDSADFSMQVRSPTLSEDIASYWYVIAIAVVAVAFVAKGRMAGAKKK